VPDLVHEEQPAGYFDGGEMAGSAGGEITANDVISKIKLGPGTDAVDYDFCELLPSSISGHIFADLDNDCVDDPGEPDLAGVTVQLLFRNRRVN
jgi:hypothetical protein